MQNIPHKFKNLNVKKVKHYLQYEAPICRGYATENLIWYPDEVFCKKTPYKRWQKVQMKLAKLAKGNPAMNDTFYTVEMLENIQRVKRGVKGKNPKTRQKNVSVTGMRKVENSEKAAMINI